MFNFKWIILTLAVVVPAESNQTLPYWGYNCRESKCIKMKLDADNLHRAFGFFTCRLSCGGKLETVWPKPTGIVRVGQKLLRIRSETIFHMSVHQNVKQLWRVNKKRFRSQIASKIPDPSLLRNEGKAVAVYIEISQTPSEAEKLPSLTYDTDESYSLHITDSSHEVMATIKANSFFGARHGLETLSQLIVYDEIRHKLLILGQAEITDAPVYKHRGVMLDTARNYFSLQSIKRTIEAMAMNKMNRFHWHIVDTTSFPLVIGSQPDLHMSGAYSPQKIYTPESIGKIIWYARARGVSVYPEMDAPRHVGEGWQSKNMTVCFKMQPWTDYCPRPPCGILDPTNENVYGVLEDIYREIFKIFDLDVFHMGVSTVDLRCWKSDKNICNWMLQQGWRLDERDFMMLWDHFRVKALAKVDKVSQNKKVPIIVWTEKLVGYLDNSRYVIQTMGNKGSVEIREALQHGHRVILSNADALFLDCGFENPFGDGNNWCSPYKGWQKIYENRPKEIAGDKAHLILGAETLNWGEQLDEHTVDARFWPRSSALAERMWSDPDENWRAAEARMLLHRERLVENGIAAAALQPEWCLQHEGDCMKR